MKEYKVIKEFGCAQKGDVLKENEEGLFEINAECNCDDIHSVRHMCVSSDIINTLSSAGYVEEIFEEGCECCEKIKEVINHIDELIDQYKRDHDALLEEYNEGELPQCVKVEADTVYFNMNKVLEYIKSLLIDE